MAVRPPGPARSSTFPRSLWGHREPTANPHLAAMGPPSSVGCKGRTCTGVGLASTSSATEPRRADSTGRRPTSPPASSTTSTYIRSGRQWTPGCAPSCPHIKSSMACRPVPTVTSWRGCCGRSGASKARSSPTTSPSVSWPPTTGSSPTARRRPRWLWTSGSTSNSPGPTATALPCEMRSPKVGVGDAGRPSVRGCRRVRVGLFENPYVDEAADLPTEPRRAERRIARKSIVLLKNDSTSARAEKVAVTPQRRSCPAPVRRLHPSAHVESLRDEERENVFNIPIPQDLDLPAADAHARRCSRRWRPPRERWATPAVRSTATRETGSPKPWLASRPTSPSRHGRQSGTHQRLDER